MPEAQNAICKGFKLVTHLTWGFVEEKHIFCIIMSKRECGREVGHPTLHWANLSVHALDFNTDSVQG